jgi:hypothetical protein
MSIIESYCQGKTKNPLECEDILVIGKDFYAVIDGVTSKSSIKRDGKTLGRFCAELLHKEILSLDKNADWNEALFALNDAVKKAYGDFTPSYEDRMQACVIIYSKAKGEIWSYGDCQLMINQRVFDHSKSIDKVTEGLRALVISTYLQEGGDKEALFENDIGREAILPYLKKQSLFANKDGYFGYGVIDGTGINSSLVKRYMVKSGDFVVLASDGYPRIFQSLEESEEYLRWAMEIDPLSIKENMQTKMKKRENLSFDDRTYLSFIVD